MAIFNFHSLITHILAMDVSQKIIIIIHSYSSWTQRTINTIRTSYICTCTVYTGSQHNTAQHSPVQCSAEIKLKRNIYMRMKNKKNPNEIKLIIMYFWTDIINLPFSPFQFCMCMWAMRTIHLWPHLTAKTIHGTQRVRRHIYSFTHF